MDNVDIDEREVYFGIDKLVLNAPDLSDAVNSGYQSTFDQEEGDAGEDEDGEQMDESYDQNGDDGRKMVMDALDEFTQVLWNDTKVKDKKEHELRRTFFDETVHTISTAIQKYFKYTRI